MYRHDKKLLFEIKLNVANTQPKLALDELHTKGRTKSTTPFDE